MRYPEMKNKSVLITGGTQGIGEAMAVAFSQEGAKVMINGRKYNEKVRKVADKTNAAPIMGDIGDPEDVKNIVSKAIELNQKIDVLVCNAAYAEMGPFLEKDDASWWKQLNINLTGHLMCIKDALPHMIENGGGVIIIIGSYWGILGWPDTTGYSAVKSALIALAQHITREYEKYNIRAEIINPGVIDTEIIQIDAQDLGITLEEMHAIYAKDNPMGRIGKPSEIAELALFMATEAGSKALGGRQVQVTGGEHRVTPAYL